MHPQRSLIEAALSLVGDTEPIRDDIKVKLLHHLSDTHDIPRDVTLKRFGNSDFNSPHHITDTFLNAFNIQHSPEHKANTVKNVAILHGHYMDS